MLQRILVRIAVGVGIALVMALLSWMTEDLTNLTPMQRSGSVSPTWLLVWVAAAS